jgi:hypothetical protein
VHVGVLLIYTVISDYRRSDLANKGVALICLMLQKAASILYGNVDVTERFTNTEYHSQLNLYF